MSSAGVAGRHLSLSGLSPQERADHRDVVLPLTRDAR
jgi:hypothetical protein